MDQLSNKHWTERSTEDYLYRIASDFVRCLEASMGDEINQARLADRLGVSEGRVSQFLNNPGNFTLRKIIEYARALGLKVAIVGYNDGDTQNLSGPIPAEIFSKAWEKIGAPRDFEELNFCGAMNNDICIHSFGGDVWTIKLKTEKSATTKERRSGRPDNTASTGGKVLPYPLFEGE